MLPTQKKRQIGQICVNSIQMFLWTEQHEIQDVTNTLVEYLDTRAQHLYLTSREKIREGDWVLLQKWEGNTPKNTIVKAENAIGHKVAGTIMPFEFDSIKIEATTDKNLGIGLISGTFIRKYLEKQGAEMSEVMVDVYTKAMASMLGVDDPFFQSMEDVYTPKIIEEDAGQESIDAQASAA